MPGTERVEITGPNGDRYDEILTPQAIDLIATLHTELGPRRQELLAARRRRQVELSNGATFDFLPETAHIRSNPDWRVASPAPGLVDRRVEITGPTERKMMINALNSGANVWLADFEDANSPLWENMVDGQLNLIDALDGTIGFRTAGGPRLRAAPRRGAGHASWSGRAAGTSTRSTSWSTAQRASGQPVRLRRCTSSTTRAAQIDKGKGPYFYLPKIESHLEARLWNDAFNAGPGRARHPARHDPRHGADRDDPGRVRDGRDPLRAARPLGRAQRRAAGTTCSA